MILRLAKRKGGIAMVIVLVVMRRWSWWQLADHGSRDPFGRNTRFNPDLDCLVAPGWSWRGIFCPSRFPMKNEWMPCISAGPEGLAGHPEPRMN